MNVNLKKNVAHLAIYAGIILFAIIYLKLCKHSLGIPCLYYTIFHKRCPSCGATRALISLLNLDISAAVSYNGFFAVGIYPISALIILQDVIILIFNLAKKTEHISFLQYLFGKRSLN